MTTTIKKVITEGKYLTAPAPYSPVKKLCNPNCEICGGLGYVRFDVPLEDPRFGKTQPCPALPLDSSIYDHHGLNVAERAWTWDKIILRENVTHAIQRVKQALHQDKGGLVYLWGGPGLAKTLILKIACAEFARSGYGIFHYASLPSILDDLRVCYDDDEPQRALRDKQEKYKGFALLAVDEIGAERKTDFAIEEFFKLIDARHESGIERGENKLTFMAGNTPPRQLDFRIADRLSDGRNGIVQLTGESARPGMRR